MIKRIMVMAALTAGFFLIGVKPTQAREDCIPAKVLYENKVPEAEAKDQLACWERKVKSGERNLKGAYLRGSNLKAKDFGDADLTEAILWEADLTGAQLNGANLSGAFLMKDNLRNATLKGANLRGADLRGADLSGVKDLESAEIGEAGVSRSKTKGVDFDDWLKRGGIVVD